MQLEEIKDKYGASKGTDPVDPDAQEKYKAVEQFADQCMTDLNNMFAALDERRRVIIVTYCCLVQPRK